MNRFMNIKAVVVGVVLLTLLCLLTGAAGHEPLPQVGRFQIDCTNTSCYLVDTVTGQVWNNSHRDFYKPKLQPPPVGPPAKAQDFIGQWRSDEEDAILWLEKDGSARANADDKEHQGRWRVADGKIVVTIDDDTFNGEIAPDGALALWEEGFHSDGRVRFRRVK